MYKQTDTFKLLAVFFKYNVILMLLTYMAWKMHPKQYKCDSNAPDTQRKYILYSNTVILMTLTDRE